MTGKKTLVIIIGLVLLLVCLDGTSVVKQTELLQEISR